MNIYIEIIRTTCISNKYTNWYISIISKALSRIQPSSRRVGRKLATSLLGYAELHHIWPKCVCIDNQVNDKHNLVYLTGREHFICHRLLTKMFNSSTRNKMLYALTSMVRSRGGKRVLTGTQYNIIRKALAKLTSQKWLGVSRGKGVKKPVGFGERVSTSLRGKPKDEAHRKKLSYAQTRYYHNLDQETKRQLANKIKTRSSNSRWVTDGITQSFTDKWENYIKLGWMLGQKPDPNRKIIQRELSDRKILSKFKTIEQFNNEIVSLFGLGLNNSQMSVKTGISTHIIKTRLSELL